MADFIKEMRKYEPRGMHHQLPVVWNNACNHRVWDIHDKEYIDFTSGIFVTNVGHGTIAEHVANQARKLMHCYSFPNMERLLLAKKITDMTGFEKVFFMSAGTEATEAAVKMMRLYSKKPIIVAIAGAMHGKTMLAEQLKGNYEWADTTSNVWHIEFQKPTTKFKDFLLECPLKDKIAGFMIESYRGWDAEFYPKPFIQDLCKWAKKNKILVCFDEIQGGFGRTGKLFAYEHYEVKPDMVCCGKGLGGGIPISAVLGPAKVLDTPDDLSSTHSANPLSCAGAYATLQYMEDNNLVSVAHLKGVMLAHELAQIKNKGVTAINCQGLLAAVVFKTKEMADKVIYRAMNKGLLCVYTGRESIKLGPPLTIPLTALVRGVSILRESINEERTAR